MSWVQSFNIIPVFVLVFFRTAGLMMSAPLFGSTRIPKRVKVMMALVMAMGMMGNIKTPQSLPDTTLELVGGIVGEIVFGLIMGMSLSMVFVAVQWAGDVIGQQMGINLAETFDPQFGGQSSLIGEMYYLLSLVVFLLIRGHHAVVLGLSESFAALPLLSVGLTPTLLDLLLNLLTASTVLAMKVSAPMLVTMLVVDLALGFIGKTMPQINVMSSGLTLRAGLGMVVLIVSLMMTTEVTRNAMVDGIEMVTSVWRGNVPLG